MGAGLFITGVGGVFLLMVLLSLGRAVRLLIRGVHRDAIVVGFTHAGEGDLNTLVEFTAQSGETHRGELSLSRKTVIGDTVAIMYAADDPRDVSEPGAALYLPVLMFALIGSGFVAVGSAILVGWISVG